MSGASEPWELGMVCVLRATTGAIHGISSLVQIGSHAYTEHI